MDFSNFPHLKRAYNGANGNKISVKIDNDVYMIKFPSVPSKNKDISYTTSCFSEYLGSHIFNDIGIKAQETILGTYTSNSKRKIVVACKDFTVPEKGIIFQDFGSFKNQCIDSERNGYGTELEDVLSAINEHEMIDNAAVKDHFWNMFIVDAFIANWDRHNGNWGFLYDAVNDVVSIAPVFDCGSSLFPQVDDKIMEDVLTKKSELNARIYERPTSSLNINGKRIRYFDFISSDQNPDCTKALQRIVPAINMDRITDIIYDMPYISDLRKEFYILILSKRKELILDFALDKTRVSIRDQLKEAEQKAMDHNAKIKKSLERNEPEL